MSAGSRWLLAQNRPCAKELYFRVANAGTSQILRGFVAASALFCLCFLEALPHCPVNASGLWLD